MLGVEEKGMIASIWKKIGLNAFLCGALGFVGVAGFAILARSRTPPETVEQKTAPITSKAIVAQQSDVQTVLNGFGEIRAWRQTEISAEVAGHVASVHPRLRQGETVCAGELLFEIDPSDYANRVCELEAESAMAHHAASRIAVEQQAERERLGLMRRSLELASANLERARNLFAKNSVGSQASVDAAEREYNAIADQTRALQAAVDLHPIQAAEAELRIKSATASLDRAQHDLARCRVEAPYDARIVEARVEKDQWVAPGSALLTLADDSVREVRISLDAADARAQLSFASPVDSGNGWFPPPVPVDCRLFLPDQPSGTPAATGRLHRIVQMDRETRMVTVAIRLEGPAAAASWPVADGMFCRVEIPGRRFEGVIAVPRHALNHRSEVYCAAEGVLKTTPVHVAYTDRDKAYIDQGLAPGDQVLVSRLANPLENSPVAIEEILP